MFGVLVLVLVPEDAGVSVAGSVASVVVAVAAIAAVAGVGHVAAVAGVVAVAAVAGVVVPGPQQRVPAVSVASKVLRLKIGGRR